MQTCLLLHPSRRYKPKSLLTSPSADQGVVGHHRRPALLAVRSSTALARIIRSFRSGLGNSLNPPLVLGSHLSFLRAPAHLSMADPHRSPKCDFGRDDRCFSVSAFVTLLFPLSLLSPARGVSQLVCCLRCPGLSVLLWPAGRFAFASRPSLRAARARSRARHFALIRPVAFNPRLLGQPPRLSPRF